MFPKELTKWLNTLPEPDKSRETQIAKINIARILKHKNQ